LAENGLYPDRWELCAFNNLCNDKYLRLGTRWGFGKYGLLEADHMNRLVAVAKNSGVDEKTILWTGSVKTGKEIVKHPGNQPRPVDYCRITGLPDNE